MVFFFSITSPQQTHLKTEYQREARLKIIQKQNFLERLFRSAYGLEEGEARTLEGCVNNSVPTHLVPVVAIYRHLMALGKVALVRVYHPSLTGSAEKNSATWVWE